MKKNYVLNIEDSCHNSFDENLQGTKIDLLRCMLKLRKEYLGFMGFNIPEWFKICVFEYEDYHVDNRSDYFDYTLKDGKLVLENLGDGKYAYFDFQPLFSAVLLAAALELGEADVRSFVIENHDILDLLEGSPFLDALEHSLLESCHAL